MYRETRLSVLPKTKFTSSLCSLRGCLLLCIGEQLPSWEKAAALGEYKDGSCLQRPMQRVERYVLRRLFLLLDQLMGGEPSSFFRGGGYTYSGISQKVTKPSIELFFFFFTEN